MRAGVEPDVTPDRLTLAPTVAVPRAPARERRLPITYVSFGALAIALILPAALAFLHGAQVYWLYICAEFFIMAVVAVSLDLLMGRTGQISLGHSGFFAVGAYTAAILNVRYGVDLIGTTVAAGVVAGIASLIVGIPATRLRGHYLGIVTFGYGVAVDQIALKWDSVTGGDQGLHLHPASIAGISLASPVALYYVALVVLVAITVLVWNLTRTRIGRAFAAVKDGEIAAAAMGVPIARSKVLAFLISACLAGVAGAVYAFLTGFIAPEDFSIDQTLLFFAMVVIGGMGSIPGAIGGALIVFSVQQAASTVSGLSLTLFGGIIVVTALFFPRGLKGLFDRLRLSPKADE